jgi:hypothetical protein
MPEKLNSEIAVIGIDIGKNSFHIVGQDRRGALVLRQKWSRGQVEARLANLPPGAGRQPSIEMRMFEFSRPDRRVFASSDSGMQGISPADEAQ